MREPNVRIVIVEYDPAWPMRYEEERARLAEALGPVAARIDHIGSTSVPGLPAKSIIDIQVTVERLGAVAPYIELLAPLGYTYYEVMGNAERYAFGKGAPHTHHLHIVERGGEEDIRPIAFRDYLRAHPETAWQYAALKRDLAARFADDRRAYNAGKTDFIRRIEAIARES